MHVRGFLLIAVVTTACGPKHHVTNERLVDEPIGTNSTLADEDRYVPSYGRVELARALTAERVAYVDADRSIAQLEAREADTDQIGRAKADWNVRGRFIASLEECEASSNHCPPRLDDPPWRFDVESDTLPKLEADLRFDLESWRVVAAELFGRACACRTVTCLDGIAIAMNLFEKRPTREVLDDEVATVSLTRARECIFRLSGRVARRSQQLVVE